MLIENLYSDLKGKVSSTRYNHIMGVLSTAKEIGKKYNVSQEKIEIAVLLHDILKEQEIRKLRELCAGYNYVELENGAESEIIHGFAAAVYAIEKYNIYDVNILNAVKYHTIGRKDMSLLEKVIYIADGVEPGRTYPEVKKIRELLKNDLDRAIFHEIENKILYLLNNNKTIHPNAFQLKDWIFKLIKEGEKC